MKMKKKYIFGACLALGIAATIYTIGMKRALERTIDDAFDDDWAKDVWG